MLANNLANATTVGYKSDREFYSLYASAEATAGSVEAPEGADTAPVIESHWTDLAQGVLRTTGNSLDLAIDGSGFFTVKGPSSDLFTRNGNFRLSPKGTLVTADGYPVQTANGGSIQSQAEAPLEITPDGTVNQQGQSLGQIRLVSFSSPSAINKQGANYFTLTDANVKPPRRALSFIKAGWKIRMRAVQRARSGWSESCASSRCCSAPPNSGPTWIARQSNRLPKLLHRRTDAQSTL